MQDFDHQSARPVDWLMGSALMFKKEIKLETGEIWSPQFDERFFMYFEDIDLSRQFWQQGLKVVYQPAAVLIHDHARESAKYPWYQAVFRDSLAREHIKSWLKYSWKWRFKTTKTKIN